MKNYVFWQNESFLARNKLRFWISNSKYIIWARGLSSDFGSSEFSHFWKSAVTFMWKIEHCGSDKKCGFFINGQFCMCLVFFIQPLHSIYIHSFKEFFHSIASYSSTILSQLILLHALSTLCWHDWAVIMPFRCLSSELFIEVVERIAFDILCHPQTQLNILKMPLHWDKVGVIL